MKHKVNKKLIGLSLLGLAVVVAASVYFYTKNYDPTKNYQPKYDVSSGSEKESTNNSDTSIKNESSQSSLPSTSESVPASTSGSLRIVDASQANGFVNVKAETSDFMVQTCVYQFSSDGARPVTRETQGECSGISIPQAEFEKIGDYTLTVTAYSTDQKLTAGPQIINIR